MKKLHLGCGEQYLKGYINVDYPSSEHPVMAVRADVYQDIRTLYYPEGSIDEVRTHHLFEHFSRTEALRLLLRWRRWLRPGGKLVIETPDFAASAQAYALALTLRRKTHLLRHVFGSQEAQWAYHLDGWDKAKFRFVLSKFGFSDITVRRYRNSIAQRFPKIPFMNFLGSLLPESFYSDYGGNKLPNIVVTARKNEFAIDERKVAKEILSNYLVGKEGYKLFHVWMKEFEKP